MLVTVTFDFPTISDIDSQIAELIIEDIASDSKVWSAQLQYTHNIPCTAAVEEVESSVL